MASRYTARQTTVRFEDGAAAGLTIGPGEGNLTISNIREGNQEVVAKYNRGAHDGFVKTQDLVQDCSISIELENQTITDGSNARVLDFMRKAGTYASATSLDSTICAWKTIITMTDGATTSTITLPVCEGSFDFGEAAEGNTISVSFRCHGAPVFAAS